MTLALHGKSRQRQWLLAIIGLLAVMGALMAALAAQQLASAGAANLNPDHVGATNPGFSPGACPEVPDGADGPYGWHFIAKANANFTSLNVVFKDGANVQHAYTLADAVQHPDASHAYIFTPEGYTLFSGTAVTTGSHTTFNLSHVCAPDQEDPDPSVSVEKSHSPAGPFQPGDAFDWIITVTVSGDATTDDTLVSDEIDSRLEVLNVSGPDFEDCGEAANVVTCTLPEGRGIDEYEITVSVQIADSAEACPSIPNDVVISGDNVNEAEDSAEDSVVVVCEQELDPEVEKTYAGTDGTTFSWTVEITNPDDEELDVKVNDPGANLIPHEACEGLSNPYDCTVPAESSITLTFYSSEAAMLRLGCENTVTVTYGEDGSIQRSDTVDPEDSPCATYPVEICKVFLDNADGTATGDTTFDFTLDGSPLGSITVAEGESECEILPLVAGKLYTIAEVLGSIDDADGFPKVALDGNLEEAEEGNELTFAVVESESVFCARPVEQVDEFELRIEAIEIAVVEPLCTITFWNQEEAADSNVTIDKSHTPAGPFNPGEFFAWIITVTVEGDPTTGDQHITDSIPLAFFPDAIGVESPLDCNATLGNLIDCTLPAGTPAGEYSIEITVQVSPDLTGQLCTTYTNTVTITGHDVVGTPIQNGEIPTYTTSDTDGVIIECDETLGSGFLVVHKNTIARHNNGAPVDRPNDDDGWTITVTSEECDINISKQTDANGNAVFEDLPLCTDYVVSENPVNPSSPGYTPLGGTSVDDVTPSGQTITFTNAILTFDPPCTNINQCGPVTLTTPEPTPTNTPVVPPTNTPVPPTATPEEAIEGEKTPGPATPIAPDTGSGSSGSMAAGMNMLLVLAGLITLGSGLAVAAAARRTR